LNTRLLIDAIIQQTTVLIAQLSTAAGLRSPLAHVADEVFLSLAQEIERQGVSRKVAADMFGLALRSYQRKVQRLEESRSATGKTLWEAVLEYVTEHAPIRRDAIVERFRYDDELAVTSVLADLLSSGLLYSSGRAEAAVYGITSDADRRAIAIDDSLETLATLLWGAVFRSPGISTLDLLNSTRAEEGEVRTAVERLVADGRVTRDHDGDGASLHSASFVIPEGAALGWEAAVFDHYQALASAVAGKLRLRGARGNGQDRIGGTTVHFGIYPGHPFEERVLGSLCRVREDMDKLWDEVSGYNGEHPIPDEAATRVTFYFGQHVMDPADAKEAAALIARVDAGERGTAK
jgi:hypothetical protein